MSDLKKSLIRLGHQHPELRDHLRPVLADLERDAVRVEVSDQARRQYEILDDTIKRIDAAIDQYGYDFFDSKYTKSKIGYAIQSLRNLLLLGLRRHILEDREVPRKDLKKLERALHTIGKMSRMPNKPGTWWLKNRKHVEVIYNTRTYPTRDDEDTELSFDLRGFTVFNTIRAEGQEMDEVRDVIERGVDAMKRSRIPIVPQLLYGKLKIVGKISKSNTLAWYNLNDDDVSVRTRISSELDAVHSLIHELGHRWYNRFLDSGVKSRWAEHHRRLRRKKSDYPMPHVGDPLGIQVRGHRGKDLIVERIEGAEPFRRFYFTATRYMPEEQLAKIFKRKNFPTAYASTDHEEHFCESFAMYCLGTLNQDHRDAFEEIVLGIDPAYDTVVPVVEESVEAPAPDEDWSDVFGEAEGRALLTDLYDMISREKDIRNPLDIMEGGSEDLGVVALGMDLGFEIETTESRVPYNLVFTVELDDEELILDANPKPFDYSIDNKKVDLKGKNAEDIGRYVLRLLNDYEDDLVDMVAPGASVVSRPPKSVTTPAPEVEKVLSHDAAKRFLEDIIKSLSKVKRPREATQPVLSDETVESTLTFDFETDSGNTPYTLKLEIEGNTLRANAEPQVFDGNIVNKTLQLNPDRKSDDVAKAIELLLRDYEDGLYEMVGGF